MKIFWLNAFKNVIHVIIGQRGGGGEGGGGARWRVKGVIQKMFYTLNGTIW